MSGNVNLLIEQMNKEHLKKKRLGVTEIDPTLNKESNIRIKAAEQEIVNTDKSVQNLLKEHNQLKKRLTEV